MCSIKCSHLRIVVRSPSGFFFISDPTVIYRHSCSTVSWKELYLHLLLNCFTWAPGRTNLGKCQVVAHSSVQHNHQENVRCFFFHFRVTLTCVNQT